QLFLGFRHHQRRDIARGSRLDLRSRPHQTGSLVATSDVGAQDSCARSRRQSTLPSCSYFLNLSVLSRSVCPLCLTLGPRHGVRALRPISLLELLARTHGAHVRNSIDGENPVQVIDLVLQKFRQVPLFVRANFLPLAAQI